LTMPQFTPERLKHYFENFQKYVDGKMELAELKKQTR